MSLVAPEWMESAGPPGYRNWPAAPVGVREREGFER